MKSKEYICDDQIGNNLINFGFVTDINEGRLILLELIVKAGAGYYNSHTEEGYLKSFRILKQDRTPNKLGRRFICSMIYASSNARPDAFELIREYRF